MRLRIQTLPPLPELKVWFVPRPTGASLSLDTITELKRALCRDIRQLQSNGVQHDDIRLLLDEFELLGDIPYTEVLRDGDLVCVQVLNKPRLDIEVSKKRRAIECAEDLEGARKRRKKSVETKTSGRRKHRLASSSSSYESTESSSPSSESSSESDDDRTSESSESSSSYESTSSDSVSSPPTPQPLKIRKSKKSDSATTALAVKPVPPGYGKPSTKSRNRRRRLKRKFEKEEKEGERTPTQGVSEANLTPLGPGRVDQNSKNAKQAPEPTGRSAPESRASGTASIPGTTLDNSNGEIMMASLRNKNKKKNFRQTMVAPAVRKIVFDDGGEEQPANATPLASTQDSDSAGTTTIQKTGESAGNSNKSSLVSNLQTRVIPPSELAALGLLPSNMLVTSVEFGRNTKKKKRRSSRDTYEEEQVDNELQQVHWLGYEGKDGVMSDPDDADVYLPCDEDEDIIGDAVEGSLNSQFDWKTAESRWEHFPPIETLDQLYSGVFVCWQGLAINPQTFTPEHLLGVGRVEKVEDTSITIRQILRPGTETAAAFGIANQSENGEGEEEEYSWGDISSLGWKIVNLVPPQ